MEMREEKSIRLIGSICVKQKKVEEWVLKR